jgi:Protein of unknown function (DUF4065)
MEGRQMAGGREFSSSRFKELVLLLAWRSKDDPLMSRVKLNKLLYQSDFEAFRLLGRSITGATYVRGEFGPMAAELPWAEERLGERGYLSYRTQESGPYPQKVPVAHEGADEAQFSDEELEIARRAVAELADYGGKAASEWSHEESAGWRLRENDEVITYESGLIDTGRKLDPERLQLLREYIATLPA